MVKQRGAFTKNTTASWAAEGLFHVNFLMAGERLTTIKSSRANSTGKRTCPRVDDTMLEKVSPFFESLSTFRATVRLLRASTRGGCGGWV